MKMSKANSPLVSVISAVYNGRPYLSEAIDSILSQALKNFEFIIVNDGSTDGTQQILNKYAERDARIRVLVQENRGLSASRNRALKNAKGKYIAIFDLDDVSIADRLVRQVNFLESNLDHVVVGGDARVINRHGQIMESHVPAFFQYELPLEHSQIDQALLEGRRGLIHPAVMIRRSALEKTGLYDSRFDHSEDLDLLLRLAEIGKLANIAQPVIKYRIHEGQVSNKSAVQNYRAKKARREAHKRRGIRLPPDLQFFGMARSAIGRLLRRTPIYKRLAWIRANHT